jgi:hypothetical protein
VLVLEQRYPPMHPLGRVLLWMVVAFAVVSAVQYFWVFWKRLDVSVKRRAPRRSMLFRVREEEQGEEKEAEERDVAAHRS